MTSNPSPWAIGLGLALVACDPPPAAAPSDPVEPPRVAERESPVATSAGEPAAPPSESPGAVATSATPLKVELREVRRVDGAVEIEVSLDRVLPPMSGVRPSLRVGDEVLRRSRHDASGRLDRLVFTADAEQYARMATDAELVLTAGLFTNADDPDKPRLADVDLPVVGGAP